MTNKDIKVQTLAGGMSSLAFVGGVMYSFKHKTGFWKGFGISMIYSIAGYSLGYGAGMLAIKDETKPQ